VTTDKTDALASSDPVGCRYVLTARLQAYAAKCITVGLPRFSLVTILSEKCRIVYTSLAG